MVDMSGDTAKPPRRYRSPMGVPPRAPSFSIFIPFRKNTRMVIARNLASVDEALAFIRAFDEVRFDQRRDLALVVDDHTGEVVVDMAKRAAVERELRELARAHGRMAAATLPSRQRSVSHLAYVRARLEVARTRRTTQPRFPAAPRWQLMT